MFMGLGKRRREREREIKVGGWGEVGARGRLEQGEEMWVESGKEIRGYECCFCAQKKRNIYPIVVYFQDICNESPIAYTVL